MTFHIITIFPQIFDSYINESIIKRARKSKKIRIKIYNLRDYTNDKHKTVDDLSYGGGPGMVLKVEPIYKCVNNIKKEIGSEKNKVILFSARGEKYSQQKAQEFLELKHLIMICGRYEGVDERVARKIADEEVSIGEYVLTGGELPVLVVLDSITRLLPGVLGNKDSLDSESFDLGEGDFDFPVYTRPENFKGWEVPSVLLSGDHKKIDEWRKKIKKN